MVLEARHTSGYIFVTLTYSDESLPEKNSLDPRDLKFFLNKWRRKVGPGARFFAVGEYGHDGERQWNPHYHLILFDHRNASEWQETINECWTRDGVHLGFSDAEDPRQSASALGYAVGYVTKKLTGSKDDRLEGRYPEFFRCSRYPRLGSAGINEMARLLTSKHASMALVEHGFPTGYVIEGQWFPYFDIDREEVMEKAGYAAWPEDQFDHSMGGDRWDVDTLQVYYRAEKYNWSPAKLNDQLTRLRIKHDEIAIEKKRKQAEARAAKARRRLRAERKSRSTNLGARLH